jgi:PAS domain S-box-containing protein
MSFPEEDLKMNGRVDDLREKLERIAREAEKRGIEPDMTAPPQSSAEAVFHSTSRGVMVGRMRFDERGHLKEYTFESTNPAFNALFGSEPGSGSTGSEFFSKPGDSSPYSHEESPLLGFFAHVLAEGRPDSRAVFLRKHGRVFDLLAFPLGHDRFCAVFSDASERAAAEKERRENARFVENVLGRVNVWIVLLDERGGIVFWNPEAERLSGIPSEEALSGRIDFWESCFPDANYRASVREKANAASQHGGTKKPIETFVNGAGGERLIVEWTVDPWRFEDIGTEGVLLLGRDVSEQRRMEDKLRESELRYTAAFQQTNVVKLLIDPETGAVVDCNDAALAFYGYSREEMLALKNTDINLLSPEDRRREMENTLAHRKDRFVFHHRLKNGEVRTVEVYCSPMPHRGTTLLYSIVHDITESERLESEFRILAFHHALQARLLGGILEHASDCIFVFDREGRIRFAGRKGAELFQRGQDEMTGRSWSSLGLPEERVAGFNKHLDELLTAEADPNASAGPVPNAAAGKSRHGMLVLPTFKGEKPIKYALDPMLDDEGRVEAVYCSMRVVP